MRLSKEEKDRLISLCFNDIAYYNEEIKRLQNNLKYEHEENEIINYQESISFNKGEIKKYEKIISKLKS
jgi:hypothetical protein